MLVLGLNGSPRKGGNTDYLILSFLKEIEKYGISTETVTVSDQKIFGCIECGYCEKEGECIIADDDMNDRIYPLLKRADIIIAATPVFFYSVPAQFKALIDRTQALWAKKYFLNIKDPKEKFKTGFLLSVGATKGKNLFNGIKLTVKYFFDAVNAKYEGDLCYFKIEEKGDIKRVGELDDDIKEAVSRLLAPFQNRKKILFICRENACRSQMAKAYAEYFAGDKIEAMSAGSMPAEKIDELAIQAMAEDNLDISYTEPKSIREILSNIKPDIIVNMGCGEKCPAVSGAEVITWDLPDPAGKSIEFIKKLRGEIKNKVLDFVNNI